MKVLIIGKGYLGQKFHKAWPQSILTDKIVQTEQDVSSLISEYKPEWVLNAAGVTGRPNIDWCEDHKEETLNGNVILPLTIAKICKKENVKMVHLGSGCIYTGDNNGKGFSEEDKPNFTGSFYSLTKIISEQMLQDYDVLQLRLRMPIDDNLESPRNFIRKILNYEKVIDVKNSMTIVEDLIFAAEHLMKNNKSGIYNVVNPGAMSHGEILNLYKGIVNPDFSFETITIEELKEITKAGRSNCVLDSSKLSKVIKLPNLESRITEIMRKNKDFLS